MSVGRRPPRLLLKALFVTFGTVAALLVVVFFFVRMSVRDQVRQAITDNLELSQRTLAALEGRRQHELRAQAANLAENPTLKAAVDTYAAEARGSDEAAHVQLLATMRRELDKLAARVESDAVILVDSRATTLAAVGRFGDRWPQGRPVSVQAGPEDNEQFDGVIQAAGDAFQVARVPLMLDGGVTIGALYLATALDRRYAEQLDHLSRARTAIVNDRVLIASTLSVSAARDFDAALSRASAIQGVITLDGASHAYRQLARVGGASFYAISSIDEASSIALLQTNRSLALIAVGAVMLALVGSAWLARVLTRPIGRLSAALAEIAASHDVDVRLPLAGSSLELDTLTETFNALMSSVAEAEAQTEAAYAGAIRALAAALDARDPYTAGHSDRVSALSMAIGRVLGLSGDDIEVLRLGAMLHDIGKIGVSDEILRKPGALSASEYDVIKQHPVFGAKILRSVPFLSRHIVIVELHHERPDGQGYPLGLSGDDIPLLARVVHVADAYDAMTSARAYRAGRSSDEALRELWRCAGTEFHAEIVSALGTALRGVPTSTGVAILEAIGA